MRTGFHLATAGALATRVEFLIGETLAQQALSKNAGKQRLPYARRPGKQIRVSQPTSPNRSAKHLNLSRMTTKARPVHEMVEGES